MQPGHPKPVAYLTPDVDWHAGFFIGGANRPEGRPIPGISLVPSLSSRRLSDSTSFVIATLVFPKSIRLQESQERRPRLLDTLLLQRREQLHVSRIG